MAKGKTTLTLANGKTKQEVDKYEVDEFKDLVVTIREQDAKISALQETRNSMRQMIVDRVVLLKERAEKKGDLYKTFVIHSADDQPATVLFKNAFSKIGVENETQMRSDLGDEVFEELYERKESVSLKPKAKMDELRKKLGKDFEKFFNVNEHIAHQKNFMEKRASLRNKLSTKVNAELDNYTKQCQASPDLRMK